MPSLPQLMQDPFFVALMDLKNKCDQILTIYAQRDLPVQLAGVELQPNINTEQSQIFLTTIQDLLGELPTLLTTVQGLESQLNAIFSNIGQG